MLSLYFQIYLIRKEQYVDKSKLQTYRVCSKDNKSRDSFYKTHTIHHVRNVLWAMKRNDLNLFKRELHKQIRSYKNKSYYAGPSCDGPWAIKEARSKQNTR